jgi:predicted helicase
VNAVKRNAHFTVVIGNPPYAKLSANRTPNAESLVEPFKRMVAGERNVQPLSDDYIKFISYSLQVTSPNPLAIISMITNRSYLNGLIHRGLRSILIDSFGKITKLDCHGDNNVGEDVPKGYENENLFDIRQGVAIFSIVRTNRKETEISVGEIWGTREEKYDLLNRSSLRTLTKKIEKPSSPNFFFKASNSDDEEHYTSLPSLIEIFGTGLAKADQGKRYGNGIKSNRDALLIDFDKNALKRRIASLADFSISDDEIKRRYELEDSPYWNTKRERKKVNMKLADKHLQPITYRPFDERWMWYQVDLIQIGRGGASPNLFKHVLNRDNITLLASRNSQNPDFSSVFCTRHLSEMKTADSTRASYCFPLYVYSSSDELNLFPSSEVNLSANFIQRFQSVLGLETQKSRTEILTPENIFYYMYAVFHSPTYRSRYAEFLKIDFPRLPLTGNVALFRALCALGKELVGLHLLEVEGQKSKVKFVKGKTSNVEKGYPKYADGKVYVNEEHYFDGVREDVWEFHIGGYQVCEKWLKDRRGRELSAEEIVHYGKVVSALGETIRLMAEVDEVIEVNGGWAIK